MTIAFIALSTLLSKSWGVDCLVHLFIAMIEQWGQILLIQIFAAKHYALNACQECESNFSANREVSKSGRWRTRQNSQSDVANQKSNEQVYALRITPMRPSLIAPRTSNLGLPARFLEHTYAPLTANSSEHPTRRRGGRAWRNCHRRCKKPSK